MKKAQRVQTIKRYLAVFYDKFINGSEIQLRICVNRSKLCRVFYSLNLIEELCANAYQWACEHKLIINNKDKWANHYWSVLKNRELGDEFENHKLGDEIIAIFDKEPLSQNGFRNKFAKLSKTIYNLIYDYRIYNIMPIQVKEVSIPYNNRLDICRQLHPIPKKPSFNLIDIKLNPIINDQNFT
jgi:hypothetical protein